MESTTPRMKLSSWIAVSVAALGSLAITLTGTGMLFDNDNDNDAINTQPVSYQVVPSGPQPTLSDEMRYLEMNQLHEISDTQPKQPQSAPSGGRIPTVTSYADMRFLEMNIDLPGSSAPAVIPYEEIQFIEMNQLPGDTPASQPGDPHPAGRFDY